MLLALQPHTRLHTQTLLSHKPGHPMFVSEYFPWGTNKGGVRVLCALTVLHLPKKIYIFALPSSVSLNLITINIICPCM